MSTYVYIALNFVIAFWNAYAAAKAWPESKARGGWTRLMAWTGATMSAIGFTAVYFTVVILIAHATNTMNAYWCTIALKTLYVVIAPGVIVGGLMITVDAWAIAFRSGRVVHHGIAVYDSYATAHNTYSAISSYGDAFGSILDAFKGSGSSKSSSSSSDDNGAAAFWGFVIVLAILAAMSGIVTTALIIKKFSATNRLRSWDEMEVGKNPFVNGARIR